jgi:PPK2 family polyphosphate:nucleotide phosphotransferase
VKLKPVGSARSITLKDGDARAPKSLPKGDALDAATAEQVERIADRQRVLYADGTKAILIVLQGRDASGKDGTIRKVFTAVNPQGCAVASFKAPSELERRHDFLWRVHLQVPAHGMIGIFNRSHYEDILVPRVHGLLPKKTWAARYEQVNAFERMLADNGVVIVKFLLHISRDEQRERLQERLTDRTKNWKFQLGDLDDRERWDDFTKAYRGILENTSTDWAPWYIVPADDKDARNYLVARTIADTLDGMQLAYPPLDDDVARLQSIV